MCRLVLGFESERLLITKNLDSKEHYRNARNIYNESNSLTGINLGTMNLMNKQ